jgi:chloride channel protein, CIC family
LIPILPHQMISLIHNFFKAPIHYLRKKLSDRNFFILSSILIGLSSGLAAVLLKYFVHSIESLVSFYSNNYEEFFLFALFPLLGILLTVFYIRYFLHDRLKKGSAEIVYAIVKKSSLLPPRDMYSHLMTSALTVGFGGSVGLESPMVSTGAAIGSNYSRTYGLSYKEKTILLACGAAAGIAAAFNSPIAGVLFAIEVLLADVSASAFIPLIISAACGALTSKIIMKEGVILNFSLQQPFNYHFVPYYIILGVLAGFVSLYYSRTFTWVEGKIKVIKNRWIKAVLGGSLLFILLLIFPPLFGEGYETIKTLSNLNPQFLTRTSILHDFIQNEWHLIAFLGALIFFKAFAAAITLGSGGNGGNFAPSLFVGAYLGFVFARIINFSGIAKLPEANFSIVAMAGILSGVFYAPLTAIFLIAEITGGYELIIPLMIVSSISLLVMHFFEPLSIEGKKLSEKLHGSIDTRDKLLLSKLELTTLIETNFALVRPTETLGSLIKIIASSVRNIFPVVDDKENLLGIIQLDKIRPMIFDTAQYETVTAEQLMIKPPGIVDVHESLHTVLKKFDETGQWNLPVVDQGKYIGFLSKSSILTKYRSELLESSV